MSGAAGARLRAVGPALLVVGFVAALAGPLVDPGRVLAARDLVQFHLPLRTAFARLAAQGLPEWNPWLSGGQPLLSDPSYAAFYPPTWLGLVLPPAYALALVVLLHLALAAAGAFRLARRLGCRPAVAAFAAVAFAGGGALLSLSHALTLLLGAAWLPWLLLAADRLAHATEPRRRRRAVIELALPLALVLLNGEPAMALAGGLATGVHLLAAGPGAPPLRRRAGWLVAAGLGALALAGVQLVPAAARLAGSARAGGLAWERATEWSLPPARLVELVEPRAFGDPTRVGEGLSFGWGIHDRDYPYVLAIYPGLLVLVFGIAGIARGGIAAARTWRLLALLGLLLALGRHTPLYELLFRWLPPFDRLRYPEKFFLLAGAALVFAAALELERALAARARDARPRAGLALGLAIASTATAAVVAALVHASPARAAALLISRAGLPAGLSMEAALVFYRQATAITLAAALATLLVIALLRWRRPGAEVLATLAVLLVAADLGGRHRGLLATVDRAELEPPPLARATASAPARLWSSAAFDRRPDLRRRDTGGGLELRTRVARLDPWTGLLWDRSYALSTDYALSFTAPLRRGVELASALWEEGDDAGLGRLLGAWSVRDVVLRGSPHELGGAARLGPRPPTLPLARAVAGAESWTDPAAAVGAARAAGLPLAEREFLIGAPWRGARAFDRDARVLSSRSESDAVEVALDAPRGALVVVAVTHDRHWRATVDGADVPVLEAAAGYLAVEAPAGARALRLVYRDPWLRVGAALSGVALALLGLGLLRARRPLAPTA